MHNEIQLGLRRVTQLLHNTDLSWRAIHVAGTNGKGSICAYLSAMLHDANVPTGRFTSPHLIDRWDCIQLNEKPVSERLFIEAENAIKRRNRDQSIDATSFELLTATAFEIFSREKIEVGVIECGMGGRLDATNVLSNKLVTVIARIGLDHQAFLGETHAAIAREKAGIIKAGVPCVVDSMSPAPALHEIEATADRFGAPLYLSPTTPGESPSHGLPHSIQRPSFAPLLDILGRKAADIMPDQLQNMWCAYQTLLLAGPQLGVTSDAMLVAAQTMRTAGMPGRFQAVSIEKIAARKEPVYLDGAHNEIAFQALVVHCNRHLRTSAKNANKQVVWIVGFSRGKDIHKMIDYIEADDHIIVAEFGAVAGMPWVQATPMSAYETYDQDRVERMGRDIRRALQRAAEVACGGPIVVCGSLYLISNIMRMLRDGGDAP